MSVPTRSGWRDMRGKNDPCNDEAILPFTLDGKRWPSVTHYILAKRFQGTPYEDEIQHTNTIWLAKKKIEPRTRFIPGKNKLERVYGRLNLHPTHTVTPKEINTARREKFHQNPFLIPRLLKSNNPDLLSIKDEFRNLPKKNKQTSITRTEREMIDRIIETTEILYRTKPGTTKVCAETVRDALFSLLDEYISPQVEPPKSITTRISFTVPATKSAVEMVGKFITWYRHQNRDRQQRIQSKVMFRREVVPHSFSDKGSKVNFEYLPDNKFRITYESGESEIISADLIKQAELHIFDQLTQAEQIDIVYRGWLRSKLKVIMDAVQELSQKEITDRDILEFVVTTLYGFEVRSDKYTDKDVDLLPAHKRDDIYTVFPGVKVTKEAYEFLLSWVYCHYRYPKQKSYKAMFRVFDEGLYRISAASSEFTAEQLTFLHACYHVWASLSKANLPEVNVETEAILLLFPQHIRQMISEKLSPKTDYFTEINSERDNTPTGFGSHIRKLLPDMPRSMNTKLTRIIPFIEMKNIKRATMIYRHIMKRQTNKKAIITDVDADWVVVQISSVARSPPPELQSIYKLYPYAECCYSSTALYGPGTALFSWPKKDHKKISSTPEHRYVASLVTKFNETTPGIIFDTEEQRSDWFKQACGKLRRHLSDVKKVMVLESQFTQDQIDILKEYKFEVIPVST